MRRPAAPPYRAEGMFRRQEGAESSTLDEIRGALAEAGTSARCGRERPGKAHEQRLRPDGGLLVLCASIPRRASTRAAPVSARSVPRMGANLCPGPAIVQRIRVACSGQGSASREPTRGSFRTRLQARPRVIGRIVLDRSMGFRPCD